MHSKVIATIRNIVIAEVGRGRTIDVEAYCQILLPMCRGLQRGEFEDIVRQAVADASGSTL